MNKGAGVTAVDITLGVPLSGPKDFTILGYLAFPRLFFRPMLIRLSSGNDPRIDLFGHQGLDFVKEVLKLGGRHGDDSSSAHEGPSVRAPAG